MSEPKDLESYFLMAAVPPKRVPSYVKAARELAKAMGASGEVGDEFYAASQLVKVCSPLIGIPVDDFMRIVRSFPPTPQEQNQ